LATITNFEKLGNFLLVSMIETWFTEPRFLRNSKKYDFSDTFLLKYET